jgi:hypothetical protein
MSTKQSDIKNEIDGDVGLRSKRKLLTIVSLIMLAIQFSGASVVEANTFILKLSFDHQKGLGFLLLIAVIFLLIRYYSYARKYHEKLFKLWSSRMLKEPFFHSFDIEEEKELGLLVKIAEKDFNLDMYSIRHSENQNISWEYQHGFLFKRYINYDVSTEHDFYPNQKVNLFDKVGYRDLFKILGYEAKYQISSFIAHPEDLDVYTPYLLGFAALISYIFNEKLQTLLKIYLV